MRRETVILVSVGALVIALALTIPAIAFGLMGWDSIAQNHYGAEEPMRTSTNMGESRRPSSMMGGMMGDHEEGYRDERECMMDVEGSEEKVTVVGTVEESYHMMIEVETNKGEEVEVMVPHWWKVSMPNGEAVEVSGWELVEEYIEEGTTIKVTGYTMEDHMGCMMEDGEQHVIAYHIELPELGVSADLTG